MPALVGVHTWVSAGFPHFSSLLLHLLYFSCHSFASLGFVGTFWCIMGLIGRWAKSSMCSCALHFLSLTVWPHFYPLHWNSKEVSHSTPAYRFNRTRVDCIAISSNVNTPTKREEANCKDPEAKTQRADSSDLLQAYRSSTQLRTRGSLLKQSTDLFCVLDRMLWGTAFMRITRARVGILDDLSARIILSSVSNPSPMFLYVPWQSHIINRAVFLVYSLALAGISRSSFISP